MNTGAETISLRLASLKGTICIYKPCAPCILAAS